MAAARTTWDEGRGRMVTNVELRGEVNWWMR